MFKQMYCTVFPQTVDFHKVKDQPGVYLLYNGKAQTSAYPRGKCLKECMTLWKGSNKYISRMWKINRTLHMQKTEFQKKGTKKKEFERMEMFRSKTL